MCSRPSTCKTKLKEIIKMNKNVRYMTQAAMIAALYTVLTFIANALGLASGVIQIRFSESLCILPYFTPAAIPGLFLGCLISNILTGCALPDVIFGSIATLIGGYTTFFLRKKKWLAPLGPITANAIIVPFVLLYAYGIKPLWFSFLTVTAGEIISCAVIGMPLLFTLEHYRHILFKN